jgi:hypothetical protein
MVQEVACNFEDIYYNMDGQTDHDAKQHTNKLLHDPSSKKSMISVYCTYIYNYLMNWFFPPHLNTLYE